MKIDFTDQGNWILPVEGTLGNKAKNLYENTRTIINCGFKVPRSLVIPFEYIGSVKDQEGFTLDQINKYFPGWKRIIVRSNAPDEDLKFRFPGQYTSEYLWHKDQDYATKLIWDVLASYHTDSAKLRRRIQGLKEKGMCLLIQEPVLNDVELFDPDYSGCFSDISDLALLYFTNHEKLLEAMQKPALKKYWVDPTGDIQESHLVEEGELAKKLRILTNSLPSIQDKGWEIEFVGSKAGAYIVQTTPIVKKERTEIPKNLENIFNTIDVVGTGAIITDEIIYLPLGMAYSNLMDKLVRFDVNHFGYCLVTSKPNVTTNLSLTNICSYITNPGVIVVINDSFDDGHPFPPHVAQFMREGRIALAGLFKGGWEDILVKGEDYWDMLGKYYDSEKDILYSPTKLAIIADEVSQEGIISLVDGEAKKFVNLKRSV